MDTGARRKALIIGIISIIVVFGICGTVFFLSKIKSSSVEKKIQAGNEYLLEQEYIKAIIAYEGVIEKDPDNEEAYIRMAYAYILMGEYEEAEEILEEAAEKVKDNSGMLKKWEEIKKNVAAKFEDGKVAISDKNDAVENKSEENGDDTPTLIMTEDSEQETEEQKQEIEESKEETEEPEDWCGLEALIISNNGELEFDGYTYNAVYGKTGALIWDYVEPTFDSAGHYISTFIMEENYADTERFGSEEDCEVFWYPRWTAWEESALKDKTFISIGEDMFIVTNFHEETEIVNGKTGERFSVFSIGLPETIGDSSIFSIEKMIRLNSYSNGRLLVKVRYGYLIYSDVYYWLDKNGNFYETRALSGLEAFEDIRIDGQTFTVNDVGDYSEDVFYYSGAFYFRDGSVAMDISDSGYIPYTKRDVYTPKFENGVCRMVAFKNDKFWIFDIDRNGEVITEVEEFDINLLNY